MKDFLGKELSTGDKVVALAHRRTSSTLYLGVIEKLTDKMIVIKAEGAENDWRYHDVMRTYPDKVVKVG